ncbi:MAG: polysaccharide biosynthesis protein [Muribaculaceae bacterium]|nr:polysaccharide biosynthesis protein [Muribaculaceae bacterium]
MRFLERLTSWYFSRKALSYWCILLLDCCFVIASGILGFALDRGVLETLQNFWPLVTKMLIYLIFYVIGLRVFHTYSGVVRFSSFIDLRRIGLAVGLGLLLSLVAQRMFGLDRWLVALSPATMAMMALFTIALMWTERIIVKGLYDTTIHRQRTTRVFIYGVAKGGIAIAKSINIQEDSPYEVTGFIADKTDLVGKTLMGVKVYPNDADLIVHMKKAGATGLLVSPAKNEELRRNEEMIDSLIEAGVKILMVPAAHELNENGKFSYTQFREVNVEELLPRDKIDIDMQAVGELLSGKRILITGAAGSIGSEMVRQIAQFSPALLILVDQAETPLHDIRLMMARDWPDLKAYTVVADIANEKRMEDLFRAHHPEYVFHAAAYKHVPMMEDNPEESIENNVNGTRIIADLSVRYGTRKFVMVSTDKAVNPTNVMGCSKRICEIYVQSLDKAIKDGIIKGDTRFVTTRFGNVLGSNGSVIPLFERQIKSGGPVTVTHPDIIRFFMLIPEACKLVLEAGTMGNGGEIFVFDMGKPVRIADLARRMIQMSGAKDIEIKFTGLRDGEKLYEEVLNDQELTLPTFHEKIKIAQVREYDYKDVRMRISHLVALAHNSDDMTIVGEMKALVPEFKSQHSKYEALDRRRG